MCKARFHFETLSSTQDKAFELFQSGVAVPFLVTADIQTDGRGRRGRTWTMERGRSLAMSIGIRLKADRIQGLSPFVGLSLCQFLGSDLKIKWPNDLMLADQKVGGVLIESKSQAQMAEIAIGIGINLLDLQSQRYLGLKKQVDPEKIAEDFFNKVTKFEAQGFAPFKDAFENQMWRVGRDVELEINGEKKRIQIVGVSEAGSLITREGETYELSDQGEILLSGYSS